MSRLGWVYRAGLAAVSFNLAAGPAIASDTDDSAANIAQIMQIERNMAMAQQPQQALRYFDPNVVFEDLIPGEVRGLKAVGADITAAYANSRNLKMNIISISVYADTHLGFAYSIQHLAWQSTQTGKQINVILRQTDCYHKVGDHWLLVYQHDSVPFDPATGKAVFNEKP